MSVGDRLLGNHCQHCRNCLSFVDLSCVCFVLRCVIYSAVIFTHVASLGIYGLVESIHVSQIFICGLVMCVLCIALCYLYNSHINTCGESWHLWTYRVNTCIEDGHLWTCHMCAPDCAALSMQLSYLQIWRVLASMDL